MASNLWVFLVMFVIIQQVFTRDCSDIESLMNCNECIRCGGHWCNNPNMSTARCTPERYEGWCPDGREELRLTSQVSLPGNTISPVYSELTATVEALNLVPVVYKSSTELKANLTLVNTTQGFDVALNSRTKCLGDECTITIETIPGKDFCSPAGRTAESVTLKLNVEGQEEVNVKYHVPCACECSQKVEKNSSICNHRGDFSCGVCSCRNGWTGEFCEKTNKECKANRGDIQCTNPARDFADCSGNGYCGPCETCECFTDRPGSQYFDKDNFCTDICMVTNDCDTCLRNPDLNEPCFECTSPITFRPLDKNALQTLDSFDRYVWVKCNSTLEDGCYVEYAAMKEHDEIIVMMLSFCDATAAPVVGAFRITIPVILGIVGILAAVAAVAGYAAHRARTPPLPLTDPQYQNIGAEDCTGENPLYKPPTSSFKNPTYGKW